VDSFNGLRIKKTVPVFEGMRFFAWEVNDYGPIISPPIIASLFECPPIMITLFKLRRTMYGELFVPQNLPQRSRKAQNRDGEICPCNWSKICINPFFGKSDSHRSEGLRVERFEWVVIILFLSPLGKYSLALAGGYSNCLGWTFRALLVPLLRTRFGHSWSSRNFPLSRCDLGYWPLNRCSAERYEQDGDRFEFLYDKFSVDVL
jgi:hypothetical protein